jgi:GxxExxY protein
VDVLLPIHKAQTITYLKVLHQPLALLINFNVRMLIDGVKRVIVSENQ